MRISQDTIDIQGISLKWGSTLDEVKKTIPNFEREKLQSGHYQDRALIEIFKGISAYATFSIPEWGFLEAISIGQIECEEKTKDPFSSYAVYRDLLVKAFGQPKNENKNEHEGEPLKWILGEPEISLSVQERFGYFLTFKISHRSTREENNQKRIQFNKVTYELIVDSKLRSFSFEKSRIRRNLKLLIKAAKCHHLENGVCTEFEVMDIDPYWFDQFGRPKSVAGEDYEKIKFGYTGGSIKVLDRFGRLYLEETY